MFVQKYNSISSLPDWPDTQCTGPWCGSCRWRSCPPRCPKPREPQRSTSSPQISSYPDRENVILSSTSAHQILTLTFDPPGLEGPAAGISLSLSTSILSYQILRRSENIITILDLMNLIRIMKFKRDQDLYTYPFFHHLTDWVSERKTIFQQIMLECRATALC